MSHFVISLFMRSGAYDETDVARTSMVLAILAFSIPIESLVERIASQGVSLNIGTAAPGEGSEMITAGVEPAVSSVKLSTLLVPPRST